MASPWMFPTPEKPCEIPWVARLLVFFSVSGGLFAASTLTREISPGALGVHI